MGGEVVVIVIPYPVQGHINPMVQFAKRLVSTGLVSVTLVVTNSIQIQFANSGDINVERISDGFKEGEKPDSIDAMTERFKHVTNHILPDLIQNLNNSTTSCTVVKAIVYDSFMPWILDIALNLGIPGASFFTQSCAVSAIYYHHSTQLIPNSNSDSVLLPGMPLMQTKDLPSFISDVDSYPAILRLVLNRFTNFHKAHWLFFNTFDKLEHEVVNWMSSQWQIKTIGPTVPSPYLDKRLEDDKDYGLSLFKPDAESCINWLDTKQTASVVYVSFGSLASLGEDQMEELALGLLESNRYILWVVRETEMSKLPVNTVMGEDKSEKILVVNWCPQLQVLAHPAVGCFLTHCGWNSTLESLSLGVPMLALPQWTDQTTNAKYIVDVWGAGVRVKVDEKGNVKREEIERCIKQVMEGDKADEMRKNAVMWKNLARAAVDQGGSSDNNIMEFISKLTRVEVNCGSSLLIKKGTMTSASAIISSSSEII